MMILGTWRSDSYMTCLAIGTIGAFLVATCSNLHRWVFGKIEINPSQNVIVITGCDSGFGQTIALELSSKGFLVVACCLTLEGQLFLREKVHLSLKCDVTKPQEIEDVFNQIRALLEDKKLRFHCLINNAGIAPTGYLDWLDIGAYRRAMEVNYFALIQVSKFALPLLKRYRQSRIINLSSMAGMSGSFSFSAYSGSKHAVEGLCKCIRQELRPWGVFVTNINPSFMRTPIVNRSVEVALGEYQKASSEIQHQYPIRILEHIEQSIRRISEDPKQVIDEVVACVVDRYPMPRIYVGKLAHILRWFLMLPFPIQDWLVSWSAGPYSPDRATIDAYQAEYQAGKTSSLASPTTLYQQKDK